MGGGREVAVCGFVGGAPGYCVVDVMRVMRGEGGFYVVRVSGLGKE